MLWASKGIRTMSPVMGGQIFGGWRSGGFHRCKCSQGQTPRAATPAPSMQLLPGWPTGWASVEGVQPVACRCARACGRGACLGLAKGLQVWISNRHPRLWLGLNTVRISGAEASFTPSHHNITGGGGAVAGRWDKFLILLDAYS